MKARDTIQWMRNEITKFSDAKLAFDNAYARQDTFEAFIPVDTELAKKCGIKGVHNEPNEEYFKWQFFYSLVNSGLYQKDYLGAEIYYPKGNKNSAPIKFDGAIFDDPNWFDIYRTWRTKKDQSSLDWLRKHLVGVIEFKKEDSKDTETVYNQQLKPALKESENDFCLGILYDAERLYLFQKKNGTYLRLDEAFNQKGDASTTKDLSLHLMDAYYKIPSFDQLQKKTAFVEIDRSSRTIDDLDIITGFYSKQLNDGIANILRTMDRVGMKSQRGYEILIQVLALKIFDEKRSITTDPRATLDFYKSSPETEKLNLLFYITDKERGFTNLGDPTIQGFIARLRTLYNEASQEYQYILKRQDTETIVWEKEEHIRIISEVVEQLQDYSFIKSHKSDLYQIVFYKFANEFSKADKGQFITPIPLIDFLVNVVNPRNTERLIDPTVGIADFLSVSYINSDGTLNDKNMYGLDNDEQMVMLAQLNMLLNGDGNAQLKFKPDRGSIEWKFDDRGDLIQLQPNLHKNGEWDSWKDQTKLKKFDVVLTNPPFGEDRKFEPKTARDKELIECYELWNIARSGNWIDLGIVFLENAYRILKENGRFGIIVSNSIASVDRWELAREWLMNKMRIVALFDLPANVFADTGVNTTLIVAYKPSVHELTKLKDQNYDVFVKDIHKVGYEVRTVKRIKQFNPVYKIDPESFEIVQDEVGNPLLDEEFGETITEFRQWCLGQEKSLQDLFLKQVGSNGDSKA